MSKPKEEKRAGNWVKSWKPYNWKRKRDNQIKIKKAEINAFLLDKYESIFSAAKRNTISKRSGWYPPSKTKPGIYRKYFFMWRKPGGGKAIVNPTTPPQP